MHFLGVFFNAFLWELLTIWESKYMISYLMKMKTVKFIPLIVLTASSLMGCNTDNRFAITYGTYVSTTAIDLSYEQFVAKFNHSENMIVATYDGELSPGCSCWTGFKAIIDSYVNKTNTVVYKIDRKEFEDKTEKFGITLLASSDPTLLITKEGTIKAEYLKSKNNEALFTKYDSFVSTLDKVVKKPRLMLVNQDYLDNALYVSTGANYSKNQIVYYLRETCGDCSYCTPHVLTPYFSKNNNRQEILCIDIDPLRVDMTAYTAFKTAYKLTAEGDATYGYDAGVVPTLQVWNSGRLVDACVYFNDSVAKDEQGKWHVSNSYYTNERVADLKYTNTVLMGMEIKEEEVTTIEEYNYSFWNQDAAAVHHDKILTSFLDYYVK